MGQAGTGVFWGSFPDFYCNPALLGYHRGVRYEWSDTRYDLEFEERRLGANRLTLGGWGFGITLSGQPISGMGGTYLSYSEPLKLVIGVVYPFDEVDTWGFGANAIEIAENVIGGAMRSEHPISRFADVSWGFAAKNVEVRRESPYGVGRSETSDRGILIRLTPYDSIDHEGFWPSFDAVIAPIANGLRVDASYGKSQLNSSEEFIEYRFAEPGTVPQIERQGYGFRVGLGLPSALESALESNSVSWLGSALVPMLAVGLAWDQTQETYRFLPTYELEGANERKFGYEIVILNVLAIRRGEYEVEPLPEFSRIIRQTRGFGLGFQVPGIGGFYFDRAEDEWSRAKDETDAFGFWVDPPGLWRALH
jgi:hypothetical protein